MKPALLLSLHNRANGIETASGIHRAERLSTCIKRQTCMKAVFMNIN